MIDVLQLGFMRNALMAGILVSIACGIIGTYVVVNRIVFLSGGIAHAAYGGIGIAYFLHVNPILGAIVFSLLSALGMGVVHLKSKQRADTVIGVMWAIGMATGIIFIDLTEGYKVDLMSYLFGSILTVPTNDLLIMLALDLLIIAVVIALYRELLAVSFDMSFATVKNIPVNAIYLILLCLVALSVVMMMRVVGLIMVIALLTIPAAISGLFVCSIRRMMILASALGIVFTTIGLWLSYLLNLTSGATIILVAGVSYLASLSVKLTLKHKLSGEDN